MLSPKARYPDPFVKHDRSAVVSASAVTQNVDVSITRARSIAIIL